MSVNRKSFQVVVFGFAIIAISALAVAAETSWSRDLLDSLEHLLGLGNYRQTNAPHVLSNGPVIFQRGFAAAFDFPYSRGGELYKVDPVTTSETFFSNGSQPNYSFDGSRVAFTINAQLATSPAASPTPTLLVNSGGGSPILGFYPKWSPDGANISYNVGTTVSGTPAYHIKIISGNCSSCDISQEFNPGGTSNYIFPTWHPTETSGNPKSAKVVFVRTSSSRANIDAGNYTGDVFSEDFTISANGTVTEGNRTNLTNNVAKYSFPSYSHDGTRLAYVKTDGNGDSLIVANADGSSPTTILTGSGGGQITVLEAVWSPDDIKIAYSDSIQLFQITVASHQISQVTTPFNSAADLFPSWAPGSGAPTPTPTPTPTPSPFNATLTFDGRLRDRVSKSDGGVFPDGESDGTFTLTLPAATQTKFIASVDVKESSGNEWDTIKQAPSPSAFWVVGVARGLDVQLENQADGTLSAVQVGNTGVFKLFIGDSIPTSLATGKAFTARVNFTDGSTATGSTTINLPTLQLKGLEVTQGVQDLTNSVPLVAGKHTFVRAYIGATSAGSAGVNVSGILTASNLNTGAVIGSMANSNAGGMVVTKENPDRGTLDDSLYFDIPTSWTQGNVQFQIAANPVSLTCNEPDGTPDCKVGVTFQSRQKLSLKIIAVTWTDTSGIKHTPGFGDVIQTANELLGIFPISAFDGDSGATTTKLNPCLSNDFSNIKGEIAALRTAECATGPCKSIYLGLMADQNSCPDTGNPINLPVNGEGTFPVPDPDPNLSWGRAALAFSLNNGIVSRTGSLVPAMDFNARAHELSHCTGNHHTQSSPNFEKGPDPNYTPISGNISPTNVQYAPTTAYGFDVNNISGTTVYGPTTKDIMSYVRPRWVGVYNYKKLFSFFSPSNSNAINRAEFTGPYVNQMVLVSGLVSTVAETGQIDPINVSNTPGNVPVLPAGTYAIRLENAQSAELATYSFEPSRSTDFDTAQFSLALPWNTNAKRIVLLHNGQVIATRQASVNTPVVHVTSPNGGENLTAASSIFTWTGSDADGDPLTYSIEYSQNGGTNWSTLAIHWPTTSYTADLTKLPGSTQARIRVTASDGFNSSQDASDANFTVARRGPQVFISTPENNHLYVGNQTIDLQGGGLDMEDGQLPSANLSWSSNLSGPLGTGATLAIDASTLPEGTHIITLTGLDADAQTGTATMSIKVFRNRPAFPAMLSAGPNVLGFGTTVSLQTIAVRNTGDGGLTWSATADQPWIKLSATSGTAPFDVDVTIIPGGLPFGTLTGKITLTSPEATNGPQIVNVNLAIIQGSTSTVSGRVITPDGHGLRNATVSITDSQGGRRTATTSSFGFFSFDNVLVGDNYTLRIGSRLYRFTPRSMQIISDLTLPDFVGLE